MESPMSGPSVRVSFMWMMTILRDWSGSKGGGEVAAGCIFVGVSGARGSGSGGDSCAASTDMDECVETRVEVGDAWLRLASRCGLRLRRARTSGSACILRPLLCRFRLRSEERLRSSPGGCWRATTLAARAWSSAIRWRGQRWPKRVSSDWESS